MKRARFGVSERKPSCRLFRQSVNALFTFSERMKKMTENERFLGSCKFCGQISAGTVDGAETQAEADEIATEDCSCYDAKEYVRLKKQKTRAKILVNEIFGTDSKEWEATAEKELIAFLHKAVDLVADNRLKSVQATIPGAGSARISMNNKNGIVVERRKTKSLKATADK